MRRGLRLREKGDLAFLEANSPGRVEYLEPHRVGFSGKPVPGLSLQGGSSVLPRGSDAGTSRGRAGISEIQAQPSGNRHLRGRQRNRQALNHGRGPSSLCLPPPAGPGEAVLPGRGGFQPPGAANWPPLQVPRKYLLCCRL